MTTIVARLFSTTEQATKAADEMRLYRLHDEFVSIVSPPPAPKTARRARVRAVDREEPPAAAALPPISEPEPPGPDTVLPALWAAGLTEPGATTVGDAVRAGGTAVVVRAPFGFAQMATLVMARHGGSDPGIGDHDNFAARRDSAAPLSSLWDWPVLSDNPTPLSSWLGMRVLSARQTGKATLSVEPAPLSKRANLPLLSDQPAPLSNRFGWRLLWDNPTPLSSRANLPVLLQRQDGRAKLLDDPAPLSNFIGMKLLSDNPAPLSKLLGWRVLKRN